MEVRKLSAMIRIAEEILPGYVDPRPGHLEPPSAAEVAAFEAWRARFEPLRQEGQQHGWFSDGGPDFGFEYDPPEDQWVFDVDVSH